MASLEATRFIFGYPVGLVYTCHIIFQIFTFFLVVILFIVFLFTQTLPKLFLVLAVSPIPALCGCTISNPVNVPNAISKLLNPKLF
jgi:hypothetical protein